MTKGINNEITVIDKYRDLYKRAKNPEKDRDLNYDYKEIMKKIEVAVRGRYEHVVLQYSDTIPKNILGALKLLKEDGFIVLTRTTPNTSVHSTVKKYITVTIGGWSRNKVKAK